MIVDLFDRLLNRFIQLKTEKDKRSATLYNEFLKPLNDNFEAIHKEYMTSFRGYKDALNDDPEAFKKLVQKISDDRAFNDAQRIKIFSLVADEQLKNYRTYLHCVCCYFASPTALDPPIALGQARVSQVRRKSLIESLEAAMTPDSAVQTAANVREFCSHGGMPEHMIQAQIERALTKINDSPSLVARANKVFDATITDMQEWYAKAQDAMVDIKRNLIMPK